MITRFKAYCLLAFVVLFSIRTHAQSTKKEQPNFNYTVSMENPSKNTFQVELLCDGLIAKQYDFKIPVWMPGYYQIMNYANDIQNLSIKNLEGNSIKWDKGNHNTWRVYNNSDKTIKISYEVKTTRSFVATNFLDAERGFIAPTGMFLHIDKQINVPVTVKINPHKDWDKIATGLKKVANEKTTYYASDFDVLYDSPILIGKLEEMPSFTVKGIPHYFLGYKLGDFNKAEFMSELKKVVETAVAVIGDIPFDSYTFIGIGPGGGGIEHLNSTAVAFSGSKAFDTKEGRQSMLSFLGHEYFHHYNAKRIRPIELGPFDYDNGSRTNMLWVAEGVTTYYDEMLLKWADLESETDLLKGFQNSIKAYENSPGRFFQSVSQASYDTWSDGPFGRTGDEVNKTISYYQKGPILALMLDLKIRHETKNKKSLDDVMRTLYYDFYKKLNRGYTEQEFRTVCEQIAGIRLDEFFNYVYTVSTPDYKKYFGYAGLDIDTKPKVTDAAWLGIKANVKDDKLIIRDVDWLSPAWTEGFRRNQVVTKINGKDATLLLLDKLSKEQKAGDIVKLEVLINDVAKTIPVILSKKSEIGFDIKRKDAPTPLQQQILKTWLR